MRSQDGAFEETHELELLNGRMAVLLLAVVFLFIPRAKMSVKTGVVFGGQLQLDPHGGLTVIDKESMRSYPAMQERVAFQFLEEGGSRCQFPLAGILFSEFNDAISQHGAQTFAALSGCVCAACSSDCAAIVAQLCP